MYLNKDGSYLRITKLRTNGVVIERFGCIHIQIIEKRGIFPNSNLWIRNAWTSECFNNQYLRKQYFSFQYFNLKNCTNCLRYAKLA